MNGEDAICEAGAEEDEEDLAYLRSLEELESELTAKLGQKDQKTEAHSAPKKALSTRSARVRSFLPASFPNDPPSQGVLGRCELLVVEQFGQGAAVSLEQKNVGVVATVWNAEGQAVMICAPRSTRTEAVRLLRDVLRKME